MLYDDWHKCWDDTPLHMQFISAIRGLLAASATFSAAPAWQRRIRPAHISNGWLIWRGFLQVLLEIMSEVVIFERCLQGLSGLPLLPPLHRDRGCTNQRGTLYLQSYELATLSFYGRDMFIYTRWVAWWADGSRILISWSLEHTRLFVLTGLLKVWSLVPWLDNAVFPI